MVLFKVLHGTQILGTIQSTHKAIALRLATERFPDAQGLTVQGDNLQPPRYRGSPLKGWDDTKKRWAYYGEAA